MKVALAFLLFGASPLAQGTPGTRPAAVAWLRDHAVALSPSDSATAPAIASIDSMLDSARVIAMGESTHGTHEFLRLRNSLFESLVSRGVTAFALETGFQDALAIDAYLQSPGGDPPPDSIARAMVAYSNDGHGNGRTENRELLRWLHEYNARHPDARVHLYGFDLSGRTVQGGFLNAASTVTAALAYVRRVDPAEAQRLADRLGARLSAFRARSYATKDKDYDRLPASDRTILSEVVRDLATDFRQHRVAWRSATSAEDYWTAAELADAALELDGFFRVNYGHGGMPPTATAYRDSAMGANALAIAAHVSPGRLFVFAHDVHVQSGGVQVNNGPGKSMGSWLRGPLERSLFVIGTIDGQRLIGATAATTVIGDSSSLPSVCAAVGHAAFVANLRALPAAGPVHDWFSQPRSVNPVAFTQTAPYMIDVARWYNAIVFVRDVQIASE